ncbi:MAG: apolipoprotein N-acyltransferase, partial [Alistipes sp.]|nr:apolipoprotein N-acyltransferase [Alistipes sp.]
MKKRIGIMLLGVLLLALPWLGGSSLTLFVAFLPLLWIQHDLQGRLSSRGRPLRYSPYAIGTFILWWLSTVWWVWFAAPIGVFASALTGTVQMGLIWMIYHAVWRRAPRALAYTVLVSGWIAYEYFFQNAEISFPWLLLGNGFCRDVKLAQGYELTGTLGGTLWVLLVNLTLFEAWLHRKKSWRVWIAPCLLLLLPATCSLYRYYTYRDPDPRTVKVSILQPNIDPYKEKFKRSQQWQNEVITDLMTQVPHDVDLIVAPETAIDERLWEGSLEYAPSVLHFQREVRTRFPGAMLVTGAITYRQYATEQEAKQSPTWRFRDGEWYDAFNSTVSLESSARI